MSQAVNAGAHPGSHEPALCPSAQADWAGSVVIGVVGGTAAEPHVQHLHAALPVTDELLALVEPVTPGEVLRVAAPCLCSGCHHFADDMCNLARRVANDLPPITRKLPRCSIRSRCRWWQQEGPSACSRCPQVVTDNYNPSDAMIRAAGQLPFDLLQVADDRSTHIADKARL